MGQIASTSASKILPSAFAVPATPVGLAPAAAGVVNKAIRSDAKLVLDLSIAPTWTGNHNFAPASGNTLFSAGNVILGPGGVPAALSVANSVVLSGLQPNFFLNETDAPADEKFYRMVQSGGDLLWRTTTDDGSAQEDFFVLTRTGNRISQLEYGALAAAPLQKFNGSIQYPSGLLPFANDAAAAAGGIPVGGLYRVTATSNVQIRVV